MIAIGISGYYFWAEMRIDEQNALQGIMQRFDPTHIEQVQAYILPVIDTNYIPIRDFNMPDPLINSRAAIIKDMKSGKTLYAFDADKVLPIASITKLATAVTVIENLDLKKIYTVRVEDLNLAGLGTRFYAGEQLYGNDLLSMMFI